MVVRGYSEERAPSDASFLPEVMALADKIAARIGDTDPETGCWEWLGAHTYNGYGQITTRQLVTSPSGQSVHWGTRTFRAHRAVWMLHHERPIDEGLVLDHLCFNKGCVNPAHLRDVTQLENVHAHLAREGRS